METIWGLATFAVVPFWLLMIVLPHWRWTRRLVDPPLVPALLGVVYLVLAATVLPSFVDTFSNPSSAGVAAFLSTPIRRPMRFCSAPAA